MYCRYTRCILANAIIQAKVGSSGMIGATFTCTGLEDYIAVLTLGKFMSFNSLFLDEGDLFLQNPGYISFRCGDDH